MTTETEARPGAPAERGGGEDQAPPRSAAVESDTFELKPVEVSVNLMTLAQVGIWCPGPDMNALFERLQKAGIDTGRPFELCVDDVGGQATARQEPWRGV